MNEDKKWDVLTYGETMAVFLPEQKQRLRYVDTFKKGVAGAESNVAIGVTKLGHSSCWISKVGDDELGEYILKRNQRRGSRCYCCYERRQSAYRLNDKAIWSNE